MGFPGGSVVKYLPANAEMQKTRIPSLGWEDPLEEEMATHFVSCLKNSMDRGAWWATVPAVTKSRTRPSEHTANIFFLARQTYVTQYFSKHPLLFNSTITIITTKSLV